MIRPLREDDMHRASASVLFLSAMASPAIAQMDLTAGTVEATFELKQNFLFILPSDPFAFLGSGVRPLTSTHIQFVP